LDKNIGNSWTFIYGEEIGLRV